MNAQDADFLKKLRAMFRVEAQEHIRTILSGLIELEKASDLVSKTTVIETMFREVHSLKGSARSVDMRNIEAICHPLESAFTLLKRDDLTLSRALLDLFHHAMDHLTHLVGSPDDQSSPVERSKTSRLIRQLTELSRKGATPQEKDDERKDVCEEQPGESEPILSVPDAEPFSTPLPVKQRPIPIETVKIPTAKLEPLLFQAEEMTQMKISLSQRSADLQKIEATLQAWKAELVKWKNRRDTSSLHSENEEIEARLNDMENQITLLHRALEQDQRSVERMVDEHLETMKKVLMLPVASLVSVLPKFVRDLGREHGKEVNLIIRGTELEMDKRILDELKDPLIHLIRNSIDHGIESQQQRAAANKPERGTIVIDFRAKDSRHAEIIVSDDGMGIDLNLVRSASIKAGISTREVIEKFDERTILSLIFQSGVSTSPIITNISGRGLGLAIVREKVEKLGGIVSADTQPGEGTTFRILLPLTLTTFRGVLIRVGDRLLILPTINVERVVRMRKEEIKTIENRKTVQLSGQVLSLSCLSDVLGLPVLDDRSRLQKARETMLPEHILFIVVTSGDRRMAFQVDEILEERQVLLKGLGRQLRRVRNIIGASVMGNGKVVPVVNISDLLKSAIAAAKEARRGDEDVSLAQTGSILVAEDSITARTLLKNILEGAGYRVATAVDGMDAFTQLRADAFDLVVSDVDMPRMSGFELTSKIRGDRNLHELPVVLVTALESREDRERGIDVGANAYIVKSSFEQSNLLEVIRRLL